MAADMTQVVLTAVTVLMGLHAGLLATAISRFKRARLIDPPHTWRSGGMRAARLMLRLCLALISRIMWTPHLRRNPLLQVTWCDLLRQTCALSFQTDGHRHPS